LRLAVLAAAAGLLAFSACGSEDDSSTEQVDLGPRAAALEGESAAAIAAAEEYIAAFEAGDVDAICRLTSQGREKDVAPCKDDLTGFEGLEQPEYQLADLELEGSRAEAKLRATAGGGPTTSVTLRKVGETWYVESASLR
jgi:hypothetical protein